jgi:transcriptional regulator with PAS, ATPase and Fis domain
VQPALKSRGREYLRIIYGPEYDLPENLVQASRPAGGALAPSAGPDDLDDIERRHVEDVLRRNGNNKVRAAKALGVSRRTLYRLIEKYGLGGVSGSEAS